jgi:hypothetical protein
MSTAAFVRGYISQLPKNQLFVTRELLAFGNRDAIDRQLGLLVAKGVIRRMARGVFVRADLDMVLPAMLDIAKAKARAFGKHLVEHGSNLAEEFNLKKNTAAMTPRQLQRHLKDEQEFKHSAGRFAVLGSSSSFGTYYGRVHFKHVAPKKYFMAQHTVGRVLVGRWWVGLLGIVDTAKLQMQANFNAFKAKQVKELAAWSVGWLNELLRAEPPRADVRAPFSFCPLPVPVYPEYAGFKVQESPPLYRVA